MMTTLTKCIALIAVVASSLFSDQFSGKRGDFWTGGSFNFGSIWSGSGSAVNIVMVSPVARFFPANEFCIGPKLSWTGIFEKSLSQNNFGLGIDLGYGGGFSVFGYGITSPHFVFINVNETYPTYNGYPSTSSSSTSHQIFFLPFSAGLIIPVANNLGVQIEGGYSVGWNISSGNHDETLNAFTIGIGICGLGQKMAVSIVNFFNLLTSIY